MPNELFSLAISNFNKLVKVCPFLLKNIIPSSRYGTSSVKFLLDFKIDSNHDFTELILSYSQNNSILDPVMTVFIIRTHAVAFPMSYREGNSFLEYNSNHKTNLSLSYFLSFWLDDLLAQNYQITALQTK